MIVVPPQKEHMDLEAHNIGWQQFGKKKGDSNHQGGTPPHPSP